MKPCWMSIVSGVGIWVLTLCSGLARAQSTPAADGFACVDITGVANRALRDSIAGDGRGGWLDQGSNDMRFLPVGRQEFLGIPFGIIEGREEACLVLQGPQPEGAAELKAINKKARSIYFLHTAAWAKKGDPGAVYTVLYEDGSKAEIPIRAGIEINDWWDPKDGKNCRVAWVGPSLTSSRVGVHLYPWPNPHPERNISAIRFASGDGKMVPIVLAVTLSDRPARLPESIVAAQEAERQEQNEAEKLEFAPGQAAMLGRKRFVGPVLQEDLLPPLTPGKDAYTPASQPHSFAYLRQYGGMHNPEKLPIGGAADVSFLNEKPAGKHGYLRVKDGKLVFEDGTPARFLSVGLTYGIMFPSTMEEARQRARWLAANGINMVRLHHFTYSGKEGASLFDFYEGADEDFRKQHGPTNRRWRNTRKYDREAWNKLDMLLAALKEEGIYVHLSAIVFPWIGDIEAAEKNIPPRGRGYDAYRTEGAQLFISEYEQKVNRLWHDLLEHKNPYTHLRHVDDPAIAGVELVNEDSIFWRGCDPDRLSAYYSMELHELWNRWLLKKYGSTEALRKAWGPDVMEDWEELISDVNSMKEGRQVPQPKRFEKAPQGFTPCDLSSAVNTTYRDIYGGDGKDGWFDSGKDDDMRFFPTGRNVYLGVPFLVSDKGPILIADKESFPDVGKGKGKRPNPRKANLWPTHARLPVAGKAGSVYFLHTAGWLPKGNAPVFHYEVEYADGTKLDIPIRSNEEISDWSHPRNSERMRVAWRGSCYSGNVGINLYAWDNPHPETPITGITARIEGNPAVVCILGVTLSDSPAKLVPISDVPVLPEWARYVRLWPYASRFTEDGWNEALLKRASDQIRFLYEVQTGYFLDQKKFLQEEIGFKGLVLGSNWKTPPLMREADRYSDAQLDILDQHNYGSSNGFMRAPGSGTFTAGQHRVLGKPMMISEWYPARVEPYRLCVFPLLCLYGQGLNGWEFPMQFGIRRLGWGFYEHWDEGVNYPMDLCQYPAMALAVRRGDVREGPVVSKRRISKEEIFAEKVGVEHSYENKLLAVGKVGTEYVDKVQPDFVDEKVVEKGWDRDKKVVRSATGELVWDYGKGIALCRTPRTQGAVGFLSRMQPVELPNAKLYMENPFGAVWLSSLDGKDLSSSENVLVTLASRCEAPKPEGRKSGTYFPVVVEAVRGRIVFDSGKAGSLHVYALDWDGRPLKELEAKRGGGSVEFSFDTMDKGPYLLLTTREMKPQTPASGS